MGSMTPSRTAALAAAAGIAIVLAPAGPSAASWEVTDLSVGQPPATRQVAAQSRGASSGRDGRATTDGRVSPGRRGTDRDRRSLRPKGFCQAVHHDRWPVRSGDTLELVARCTGTTVAELRAVNGISGNRLRPGQELAVP